MTAIICTHCGGPPAEPEPHPRLPGALRCTNCKEILVGQPALPIQLRTAPSSFRFQAGDWGVRYPGWELALDFTVEGTPVGQGGVSFLGKGRPAVHSNRKKLHPWRDSVKSEAIRAAALTGFYPITDAALVERFFTVKQPKPKTRADVRRWPTVRSALNYDIDHYDRAVFDSLQQAGIVGDDSQIIGGFHWKQFPGGPHPLCPSTLGVRVRIYRESIV